MGMVLFLLFYELACQLRIKYFVGGECLPLGIMMFTSVAE